MTAPVTGGDTGAEPDPFVGGGFMGAVMAELDWAGTPLGPVDQWPQSLRTTVNLCLTSRTPMMVLWGPEYVQLYNDALAPLLGPKHPAALGRSYAESFAEVWDDLMEPLLARLYEHGEASHLEDQLVFFHRRVPHEEMYWTFSWSPLRDEQGAVVGALHPAVETTGRVVAERRLQLLRDLALVTGQAVQVQQACERGLEVLAQHRADTPFAAVYLLDDVPGPGVPVTARLVATSGVKDVAAVFPDEVDLTPGSYSVWPLSAAAARGRLEVVELTGLDPSALLDGGYPDSPFVGVVLPLSRPGRAEPVALLALGLTSRRPLDEPHVSFLQLLACQFGTGLAAAALHEQQFLVALTLQQAMLPDTSHASSELDIAARYLPGSSNAEVGGDWFDVVPLGAGRTALVIGDVMGRGVRAAAVMGQLRAAVRAYAQLDLAPARVLELLDRLVEHVSEASDIGQIVTCVYAVHDSGDSTLTLASAGHPPPVLFDAEQQVTWQGPVGAPLGTGQGQYEASTQSFVGGCGLLLYTDGLVEHRHSGIDAGLGRLLDVVASTGTADLERLADSAMTIQDGSRSDDVALLAVRVRPAEPPPTLLLDLRGDARAARAARMAASAALGEWGIGGETADTTVLLVSELVNNALTHTGRPRQLRLRRLADRLVIEVGDADPREPRRLPGDSAAEGGRGLMILTALASDWGVRLDGLGKVVWCELPLSSR